MEKYHLAAVDAIPTLQFTRPFSCQLQRFQVTKIISYKYFHDLQNHFQIQNPFAKI